MTNGVPSCRFRNASPLLVCEISVAIDRFSRIVLAAAPRWGERQAEVGPRYKPSRAVEVDRMSNP
jgi:hypothetical protein